MPSFIHETLAQAKQSPAWGVAFLATLLMPLMLIYARAGIEVCTGLIGLSFLWQSFRTKDWGWLRAPFTLACAALWLWLLLVVTPLAMFPKAGLMEAALWFRLPLMFAALRYWVLANPAARTTLGAILGAILALIAVDCYFQFFTGVSLSGHGKLAYNRLSGPFDKPQVGHYSGQLVMPAVAICLSMAIAALRPRHVAMSLGLLGMVLIAIVMSGERSAFLTILLACGTAMGLLMLFDKRLRLPGILAGIAVIGIIAGLYATSPAVQLRAQQMLNTMEHYKESDYGQLAAVAVGMGEDHPVHGVGLHGYRELCPTLYVADQPFRGLHPHNFYLEMFAEAGVPALLLLLAMITILLREAVQQLWRANGIERLVPAIALGVMLQHFFPLVGMQSFFTNWGAVLQWYTLSIMFAALPKVDAHA